MSTSFTLPAAPPAAQSSHNPLIHGRRRYVCLQSLMKFHPSFDEVLRGIVRADEEGVVILLKNSKQPGWMQIVEGRIGEGLSQGERERIVFLEQMDYQEYLAVVCGADVNLDPYPFGGGVTVLESLACGVDVVTDAEMITVWTLADAWREEMGEARREEGGGVEMYVREAVTKAKEGSEVKERRRGKAWEVLHERDDARLEWERFLKKVTR